MGNDQITFQARFGGVARDISVPIGNVTAIYARENGAGMAFEADGETLAGETDAVADAPVEPDEPDPQPQPPAGRPKLQRIK
jgi:stringent starvation protein B